MPHRVEDPIDADAQFALAALPRPFQAFEDGLEASRIVVAPHVNHADGDVDLGMHHALRRQRLDHAPRDQFVVVRMDELPCDRFEGLDESGEVGELVERIGLGLRHGLRIVTRAQLHQRRRAYGAFEMQMQLSLGEATNERGDIVHLSSVTGSAGQ